MSSLIKYTDRDVRDNPHLYEPVVEYLQNYTGEFAYLIDCKMRVAQGMDLSVGMVRGVLNCMRNDPRVDLSTLPDPVPATEKEAEVVPIKTRGIRTKKKVCDNTDFHQRHGGNFDDDEFYTCLGVYLYDRSEYQIRATVKPEWVAVVAKTGAFIHRVTRVSILWLPNRHEPGFNESHSYLGYRNSGDLLIRTNCKHPRVIHEGVLLTEQMATDIVENGRDKLDAHLEGLGNYLPPSQKKKLNICGRCQW